MALKILVNIDGRTTDMSPEELAQHLPLPPGTPPPDPDPYPEPEPPEPEPIPDPQPGPGPGPLPNPDPNHDHFNNEVARLSAAGALAGQNSFRSEANLRNQEGADYYGVLNPKKPHLGICEIRSEGSDFEGDEVVNRVEYNSEYDAARIPIRGVGGLPQIRHHHELVEGDVWLQWEVCRGADMVANGENLKMFRSEDQTRHDKRRIWTMNTGEGEGPPLFFRDGDVIAEVDENGNITDAKKREVRIRYTNPPAGKRNPNEQPSVPLGSGDCESWWKDNLPHPQTYRLHTEKFHRITVNWNFKEKLLNVWAQTLGSDPRPYHVIKDFPLPQAQADDGFCTTGPWIHNTGRTKGEWPADIPEGSIYVRNLIVSREPIALQ